MPRSHPAAHARPSRWLRGPAFGNKQNKWANGLELAMPRIAIVTGASSGLGREFVRLIDGGSAGPVDEIWAVARRADRLDALVRICNTPVRPFCLDLTDPASYDLIEASLAEIDDVRVSLLVNNAGTGTFGPFSKLPKGDVASLTALLMRTPVELAYRALPFMGRGARIVNVSSVAAFLPQPGLALYSAAKRFVLDFSRALDAELGPVDVHVTAVCPKFMRTEFFNEPGDVRTMQQMSSIGYEPIGRVARAALRAARQGRSLCIPSPDMRALYAASRVVPYRAALAAERALGII